MFDWENLRFFVAVAQSGSLSAAARQLKVDHATVSRRLSALEAELKMRVVDRLPRACVPTAAGRQILELAANMEESAFAIERLAFAAQSPMQGTVTISVPPVLASNFFANHLHEFARLHPGIRLALASHAQTGLHGGKLNDEPADPSSGEPWRRTGRYRPSAESIAATRVASAAPASA